MANPKNRMSKSNSRARRANWKIVLPSLGICPQCHQPKMPHRACTFCGSYQGREIVKQEVKKK
ncbi:MAG: 50S ribosomal protein L32 [Bacillota bacterium]